MKGDAAPISTGGEPLRSAALDGESVSEYDHSIVRDESPAPKIPDAAALPWQRLDLDFSVFAWSFAMAVVFQLARGDMGLFRALRSTPDGTGLGDGFTAQIWFACALVTLAFPNRVWCLVLLSAAGLLDFWWRLPMSTASLYFHAVVSCQIVFTMAWLVAKHRTLRISPETFIESLRTSMVGLLGVLFCMAAFHKLTPSATYASAEFFRWIGRYYIPVLPQDGGPRLLMWFLTVCGEATIGMALLFRRTRPAGLVLGVGFACLVGSIVYGFGAIVLASVMSLSVASLVIQPLDRLAVTRFLRTRATPQAWRLGFVIAVAALFLVDHARGFTLADRDVLFGPGDQPTTADVLTYMQVLWFMLSTTALVAVVVAARAHGAAIVRSIHRPLGYAAYTLPALLLLSEVGVYAGVKDRPNIAMFAGVRVASCTPNHLVMRRRLYSSFFHRDLLLVRAPGREAIGIPALSLQARANRAKRYGERDPMVDQFRQGTITRLRGGVEEPFDFEALEAVTAGSWAEAALPSRLFWFSPVSEADLRCSMPDLFASKPDHGRE